jgi:hypothetical protein
LIRAAAVAVAFFVVPVSAQQACGPREAVVERLHVAFQERRRAAGITADGNLLEVFAADTGSWTAVVTRPGGPACIVAAGENWQTEPTETPPRRGDGA